MLRWRSMARAALFSCFVLLLIGCSGQSLFSTTPTVYDLTQRPASYANKDVTVQGYYLWKPGNPASSVLVPGLSTADGVRDAQPIYASVNCAPDGTCAPSTTAVGVPATGAVWLDGFPAEVTASLH